MVGVEIGNLNSADDKCSALAVDYRTLTPVVAAFIHALAVAGNMSIGSSVDRMIIALPLAEQWEKVGNHWPQACIVETPADLAVWLRRNIH